MKGRASERHALLSAVVADRRGADQHARLRLGLREAFDQPSRSELAAGAVALLARRGPALGDRLAGEVYDAVTARESLSRRRLRWRVPGCIDPQQPVGLLGPALEYSHPVAALL